MQHVHAASALPDEQHGEAPALGIGLEPRGRRNEGPVGPPVEAGVWSQDVLGRDDALGLAVAVEIAEQALHHGRILGLDSLAPEPTKHEAAALGVAGSKDLRRPGLGIPGAVHGQQGRARTQGAAWQMEVEGQVRNLAEVPGLEDVGELVGMVLMDGGDNARPLGAREGEEPPLVAAPDAQPAQGGLGLHVGCRNPAPLGKAAKQGAVKSEDGLALGGGQARRRMRQHNCQGERQNGCQNGCKASWQDAPDAEEAMCRSSHACTPLRLKQRGDAGLPAGVPPPGR